MSRNQSHWPVWPTFLSLLVYGSIFIHICAVASKRRIFSATECVLAAQGRSRSSKVDDFGTNRKRVCDFLLVGQCDYGPILYHFWDTATYWLKLPIFATSLSFGALEIFPVAYPLLSQEWVKLRISNLAGTFTGSIWTKVRYKFGRKGSVGVFRRPIFWVPPVISGTGKATTFKFGRCIQSVHANKSPLKIWE